MTNKERMLHMVLDDRILQKEYGYDESEYETLSEAITSENIVVSTVARIVQKLDGSTSEGDQKKVYMTVFNHINENLVL